MTGMNAQPRQRLPLRPVVGMSVDPYAPPGAAINAEASGTRLYSPLQVAGGALLGGPAGLVYFLWANFRALANEQAARWTLAGGAALFVVLVAILPVLPDRFPSWPITLAYMVAGRFLAEKLQLTKQAIEYSADYGFQSNWRVAGLGLACLVVSLMLLVGPMLALAFLGIWDPMGVKDALHG